MSFGTLASPAPAQVAVKYFASVAELSAKTEGNTQTQTIQSQSPQLFDAFDEYLPIAPFVIFGLLFVIAFGIQVANRVKIARSIVTAMTIALFAASIPATLTYLQQGSRQAVNAGPEEVPRNVLVSPGSSDSIVVSWETDAQAIGLVRLGKIPLTADTGRAYLAKDQQKTRTHTVEIKGMVNNQSYEFEIFSGNTWYDNNGAYITFTF